MSNSQPAKTLEQALTRMRWTLEPGDYSLIGFSDSPQPEDFAALHPPAQLICEAGETTLLVCERELASILRRHPEARCQRALMWVRFEAAMGWEVVGFLARVSSALAAAGVPIGAVCGYSRDHLFVAREHEGRLRQVFAGLFPESPPS